MTEDNLEQVRLSEDAQLVLRAVWDRGGEATTSEVKQEIGMDTDKIRYRVGGSSDALQDVHGLIEMSQLDMNEWDGQGIPPKVLSLTSKGERFIDEGLLGDVFSQSSSDEVRVSREQFEQFRDQLSRVENRVNSLMRGTGSSSGDGDVDVSEVTEEVLAEVEMELEDLRTDISSVEDELEDFEEARERIFWLYSEVTENQVPMLRSMFLALQEETDIDIKSYLEKETKESDYGMDKGGG